MSEPRREKSETSEGHYIIEYINAMAEELAMLADRAGCESLSRHLREAPSKSGIANAKTDR